MRAAAALVAAALAIATPARAASLGIISFAGSTPIISLAGPIAPGDDAKFKEFSQALRYPAIVRLSSFGGNTLAALSIGREIARLGYTTYVADDEFCASACGLIWLAGRQRYSGPKAKIGLHATYLTQEGKNVETSPGNALVGKYLGELGYQDDFVVYATSAPPAEMAWLNRTVTDHFNIAWEMRDQDVATSSTLDMLPQTPTPIPPGPMPTTAPLPAGPPLQIAPPTAIVPLTPAPIPLVLPAKPVPKPPEHQRRAEVKPLLSHPRTLQDDLTEFFFGRPSTEQQPLTHRASAPATGSATPTE